MDVLGDLSDGPRTFGSTNNQLQIYPYETTDAGTDTLTGVGSDGAASVSMQVINGQSFTDWIASYYPAAGSDQNIVEPNATPSADGISNIIKYALGLDPTHPVTNADRPRLFNVNRTFVGDSNGLELNLIMNPAAIDVAFGVEIAPASTGPWSELGAEDILMRESITDQGREVTATLPHMPTELAFYRISLGYIPR
jgi:hypothetical protein